MFFLVGFAAGARYSHAGGGYGGICVEEMRTYTGSSAPGARKARARRGRP